MGRGSDRCRGQPEALGVKQGACWGKRRWRLGLAVLFSELLSLSASAKLLNWYHILEGARSGCREVTEREGLDLLAEALNLLGWDGSRLFRP